MDLAAWFQFIAPSKRKKRNMLYIMRLMRSEELTWHTGKPKPINVIRRGEGGLHEGEDEYPFTDIVEVQADGHELEHIRQNFRNLPDAPNKRVVSWKGEWAQFIYDHLC